LGRRWTLTVFLTGSAVAATCYGLADSEATIIAAGCALSFFNLGAWGALYAIGPELYPTRVRGTGTGAAAAFGRIASMLAPFLVPVFLLAGGQVFVFAAFSVFFVLAAIAAFTLPEQRGKDLAESAAGRSRSSGRALAPQPTRGLPRRRRAPRRGNRHHRRVDRRSVPLSWNGSSINSGATGAARHGDQPGKATSPTRHGDQPGTGTARA